MIRRILKPGAWILGSILCLGIAAYGTAVAVNWHDQVPSETALQLAAAYRDRPPLADEDNAFIYVMGFDRLPGKELDPAELLHRYQTFITHAGWKEQVPTSPDGPLPAFKVVMDGQRVWLSNARALAANGDHGAVKKLLGDELRFWRNVLESSDNLVSKMIATAALNRHFESGNLALREFAGADVALAIPAAWDEPITDSERSMRLCLTGEWIFGSGMMRLIESDPLYQPQASMNELAVHLSQLAAYLDAPLREYQAALEQARAASEQRQRGALRSVSPYNLEYRILVAGSTTDYASYAARVSDIEGVRRAALAAVRFRERNVPASEVAAALETAPFRNPYDDRPFAWDAETGEIVFAGLQPAPKGEHRIKY